LGVSVRCEQLGGTGQPCHQDQHRDRSFQLRDVSVLYVCAGFSARGHGRTGPGGFFWAHPFVPDDYLPKLSRLENISRKVFLADACKVDRGNPRRISNQDYGYTTHGAWLNEKDVEKDSPSLSYRFEAARLEAFRHRNGLNLLFFDGHVEYQAEGDSESNNGYGSGARQVEFWFPTGTDTAKLPNHSKLTNRDLIVP